MRISVPTIPLPSPNLAKFVVPVAECIDRVAKFLSFGNTTVLTGAGISVDSGIRAYRGHDGRYLNPNYKPIFYHELTANNEQGHHFRQRYWLRSYLGYPAVRMAQPNTSHYALAALQHSGIIPRLITQNVDGLHHKALAGSNPRLLSSILELHGTLHRVHCDRGHTFLRSVFQEWLSSANPKWSEYSQEMERTGTQPRTNPDGDVAVEHLGIRYDDFVIPPCPNCQAENIQNLNTKPEVIFFGESISQPVKDSSYQYVDNGDRLLVVGTTLATFSAFRLVKQALAADKPVLMINVGPSRADDIPEVQKLPVETRFILPEVAKMLIPSWENQPLLNKMLTSGIVQPPLPDI